MAAPRFRKLFVPVSCAAATHCDHVRQISLNGNIFWCKPASQGHTCRSVPPSWFKLVATARVLVVKRPHLGYQSGSRERRRKSRRVEMPKPPPRCKGHDGRKQLKMEKASHRDCCRGGSCPGRGCVPISCPRHGSFIFLVRSRFFKPLGWQKET